LIIGPPDGGTMDTNSLKKCGGLTKEASHMLAINLVYVTLHNCVLMYVDNSIAETNADRTD
jgi:hypothetical protein